MTYLTTIGLEVHAELNTESKMFCGCKNEPHGSETNANICPVCMAHPGTLPVPNEQAIEMVLLFGRAVGAKAADFSEFDRKNYFYPDIPKAYQISQYAFPFLTGGQLEGIEITRVHLEEDTARSQHDKGKGSVVDFNRAGVPLMELVTEPVIHDAKTAGNFARELQLILRTLGISEANMEKGEMRVEANISVSKEEEVLGTKVEVKNLNSFKSVESAIEYEVNRQIECLENGKELHQETRGWDEVKLRTFVQRSKETAKDYRYFPDPDIPKIKVSQYEAFNPTRLDEIMPKLPKETREFYKNLGITSNTVEVLLANIELDDFLKKVLDLSKSNDVAKLAANYITSDLLPLLSEDNIEIKDLQPSHFSELMTMVEEGQIGSRVAKDMLRKLFNSQQTPLQIATDNNLMQMSDTSSLEPVIAEIIKENESVVSEYRDGKDASMQFLVGQGMKKTKGSANPTLLKEMLDKAIK